MSYDVIHSVGFYSVGIKMDAIPAKINLSQSIRTLQKGQYRGFCFELCGNGHTSMLLSSIVIIFSSSIISLIGIIFIYILITFFLSFVFNIKLCGSIQSARSDIFECGFYSLVHSSIIYTFNY